MTTKTNNPFVIRTIYKGIPDYPVFFGHFDRNFLMKLKGDKEAKSIIQTFDFHYHLEVEDEGIIFDID